MWWIIGPVSVILSITGIAGHKRSWHSSMHSWCRPELLRDFFTTQMLEIGDLTSWFNTLAKTCCVKTLCCWRQAEHASITCSTIPPPKYSQSSFQFTLCYKPTTNWQIRTQCGAVSTFLSGTESRCGSMPCRAIKTSAGVRAGPVCAEPFTNWTNPTLNS
jgi:hypothetical protein